MPKTCLQQAGARRFQIVFRRVTIALLKVSQMLGDMKTNHILEIKGDDPQIRADIFRVVPSLFM